MSVLYALEHKGDTSLTSTQGYLPSELFSFFQKDYFSSISILKCVFPSVRALGELALALQLLASLVPQIL